jgi:hypothetical protein
MLINALLLGAAAAVAPDPTSTADITCSLEHLNQASLQNVAVMPIPSPPSPRETSDRTDRDSRIEAADATREAASPPEPTAALAEASIPSGGKVLGYTRLQIVFTSCVNRQLRRYSEESRSAIERFFVGKTDNHVLKFDAQVDPVGVKSSVQLYSMLRNSAKDGQSWTTDVRNNDYLLPYFRLDTSSLLAFSANFQSEGSSKFDVAGSVLDIVERGANLITPTAVLITDENRERFNKAAEFVDGSLSKLFYKKVTETARQGVAIAPTEDDPQLVASVVLVSPDPRKTYVDVGYPQRVIGRWDVYAEKIKKSLFADVKKDPQSRSDIVDVRQIDPATVLNFKIGDNEVLRDRLASSEAISKASKALAQAADAAAVRGPAIGFCRLVATEAARVGLAPNDVAITAWAYLEDQALEGAKRTAALSACDPVTRLLTLPSTN